LLGPDDLVLDAEGGLYFTDVGLAGHSSPVREVPGIFYLPAGAAKARKLLHSLAPTNGIGLSLDGRRLWWTEYETGRLMMREVTGPGQLAEPARRYADCRYVHPAPVAHFDSLTMMADGGVTVAIHDGTSEGRAGILSFDADGRETDFQPFDDPYCAHIAFGGPDMRDAYVTLLGTGRIARLRWPVAGERPRFDPPAAFLDAGD
jgi:gluconolactonase